MRVIDVVLGLGFLSSAVHGAARESLPVTWTEFQRQMETQSRDSVRVFLNNGTDVDARILRIEGDGLVVSRTGNTRLWETSASEAKIPRPLIARIRVNGREGKRGLMGGLIGLGAGAALTTGTWAYYRGVDREAGFYNTAATATSIPAGALAGYLVGRFTSKLAPEYVIRADEAAR
jgi:hypothetical protein